MGTLEPSSGRSKGLSPRSKAALATIALTAAERLSDPKVRAQLAEQGRNLVALTNQWRAQRQERPTTSRTLQRHQARLDHLEATMDELAAARGDLAAALVEPRQVLGDLRTAAAVAAGLPRRTRRSAEARIGVELDALEQLVVGLTLPGRGPATPTA